jgi:hypothetical protein
MIVQAYDFEAPDRPTFVDVNAVTTYHLFLNAFECEAIMPSIRHPRWPGQEFFLTSLLSSPDDRWFAQGGPAPTREKWQSLAYRDPGSALNTLARVPPEEAAAILIQARFELPPDLAATIQAIAKGAKPTRPAEMRTRKARRTKKPPRPTTLKELAAAIRRDNPRQKRVPKFLDLIADNDDVSFEQIATVAHEAVVEDEAIEKTITKARKAIVGARLPIALAVSDRRVSKKSVPRNIPRDVG